MYGVGRLRSQIDEIHVEVEGSKPAPRIVYGVSLSDPRLTLWGFPTRPLTESHMYMYCTPYVEYLKAALGVMIFLPVIENASTELLPTTPAIASGTLSRSYCILRR